LITTTLTYWKEEDMWIVRVWDDEGNLLRTEQFDTRAAAESWARRVENGTIVLDF